MDCYCKVIKEGIATLDKYFAGEVTEFDAESFRKMFPWIYSNSLAEECMLLLYAKALLFGCYTILGKTLRYGSTDSLMAKIQMQTMQRVKGQFCNELMTFLKGTEEPVESTILCTLLSVRYTTTVKGNWQTRERNQIITINRNKTRYERLY